MLYTTPRQRRRVRRGVVDELSEFEVTFSLCGLLRAGGLASRSDDVQWPPSAARWRPRQTARGTVPTTHY